MRADLRNGTAGGRPDHGGGAHRGARVGQEADRNARAAREEAAAEVLAQTRAEAQETVAAAGRQALQIRRLAQRCLAELVAAAAGLVRAGPAGTSRRPP
ncbi:MAG TPA: hypothetical protein VH641_19845 [Streptosporangiaceae bacterium]|jgi:hypothetical protein